MPDLPTAFVHTRLEAELQAFCLAPCAKKEDDILCPQFLPGWRSALIFSLDAARTAEIGKPILSVLLSDQIHHIFLLGLWNKRIRFY